MKAVEYKKYGSPEVLQINELENPIPKGNEILVKIYASTISRVDSIFRNGDQFFARLATGISKPKKSILGFEFAGVIESIGENVKSYKTGDKIFGVCEGAHAEYICLPEDDAFTYMPADISFHEAAAIPAGALTALPFLRDNGKIKKGQKILVIGASGSVGTYAVQFAKYFGADVTGLCSTSNVELVKSLGADKVVDYTKEDFTNNGEKYDIIFDTVGKSSFPLSKKSLNKEGKFLTTYISMSILIQMLRTSIFGKKKAIIAFTGLRNPADKLKDLILIKELVEKGKIKPVIDKTYRLDMVSDAHAYVDAGHKKGNVVIIME